MPAPLFDGVIFDFDGLLVDSEPVYRRAWQRACVECGFELTAEAHRSLTGRGRRGALQAVCELSHVPIDIDRLARLLDQFEAEEFGSAALPLKEGAMDLLLALRTAGKKRALATSTLRKSAIQRLRTSGLMDLFGAIVCGDDVTAGKPAPDIFLKAASEISCVPSLCVVCEDAASGIQAACAAGMLPILIPDGYEPFAEARAMAEKVFRSLIEVQEYLLGDY